MGFRFDRENRTTLRRGVPLSTCRNSDHRARCDSAHNLFRASVIGT